MTPYQKALRVKQLREERETCINNSICPDCGSSLVYSGEDEDTGAYYEECPACPPTVVKHRFLFWEWETKKKNRFCTY